jgi:hypothetical protein
MRRISAVAAAVVLALIATPAEAAVTVYHDGVGLIYRASRGEANHLVMHPFTGQIEGVADSSMTIQDDNAPFHQRGSFCLAETPLRCPTAAVYAYMSDGDDYGLVDPYSRDAYVWGQDGDDDVFASGSYHANAYGGNGDDRVSVGADALGEAWGQADDDVVTGYSQNEIRLYGGGGDDIVRGGGYGVIVDGGPGDDRLSAGGFGITVLGQTGKDTIVLDDRARRIDGGSNDDTITGHGQDIDGNWGRDSIDVSGNLGQPDAVRCGPGADTVIADADDIVATDCETVTGL